MKYQRYFFTISIVLISMLVGLSTSAAQGSQMAGLPYRVSGVHGWQQANPDGFGNPLITGVSALEEFDGQLYAGASNFAEGGQIWRSSTGMDWTAVSEPGFGSIFASTNLAIIDLIVFKGEIYAGTGWGNAQGQLWRSPNGTDWQMVTGDGFGNPDNTGITTFMIYEDALYAAGGDDVDGLEVWRSDTGNLGSWTRVIAGGLGYPGNLNVTGFALFDGYLYLATEGPQPCQVWRSADGDIWEPVTIDGFGDPNNISMGGWAILGDYLYIGTRNEVNGAELWRYSISSGWEPVMQTGLAT